jgi:hypothetical protein
VWTPVTLQHLLSPRWKLSKLRILTLPCF